MTQLDKDMQDVDSRDKMVEYLLPALNNLRVVSCNIVMIFAKIKELTAYQKEMNKFDFNRLNRVYNFDQSYLLRMTRDLDFLCHSVAASVFSFGTQDPFLISLSKEREGFEKIPLEEDLKEQILKCHISLLNEIVLRRTNDILNKQRKNQENGKNKYGIYLQGDGLPITRKGFRSAMTKRNGKSINKDRSEQNFMNKTEGFKMNQRKVDKIEIEVKEHNELSSVRNKSAERIDSEAGNKGFATEEYSSVRKTKEKNESKEATKVKELETKLTEQKMKEEQKKKQELEQKKKGEELRVKKEAEQKRKLEEENKKKESEERLKAEQDKRRKVEEKKKEEEKRKSEEEKKRRELEKQKQKEEEEEKLLKAEEEKKRRELEKKKQEEEEEKLLKAEEEKKRKAEEKRKQDEVKRKQDEEEKRKKEEEKKKEEEEEEEKKKKMEEVKKKKEEEVTIERLASNFSENEEDSRPVHEQDGLIQFHDKKSILNISGLLDNEEIKNDFVVQKIIEVQDSIINQENEADIFNNEDREIEKVLEKENLIMHDLNNLLYDKNLETDLNASMSVESTTNKNMHKKETSNSGFSKNLDVILKHDLDNLEYNRNMEHDEEASVSQHTVVGKKKLNPLKTNFSKNVTIFEEVNELIRIDLDNLKHLYKTDSYDLNNSDDLIEELTYRIYTGQIEEMFSKLKELSDNCHNSIRDSFFNFSSPADLIKGVNPVVIEGVCGSQVLSVVFCFYESNVTESFRINISALTIDKSLDMEKALEEMIDFLLNNLPCSELKVNFIYNDVKENKSEVREILEKSLKFKWYNVENKFNNGDHSRHLTMIKRNSAQIDESIKRKTLGTFNVRHNTAVSLSTVKHEIKSEVTNIIPFLEALLNEDLKENLGNFNLDKIKVYT